MVELADLVNVSGVDINYRLGAGGDACFPQRGVRLCHAELAEMEY